MSDMEALVAIDALDDIVMNATRVPLTADAIVDRDQVEGAAGRIRAALAAEYPEAVAAVAPLLDEVERLAASGTRVPLTWRVRVAADPIHDVLDRLRGAVVEAIWRVQHARGGGSDTPPEA